jgi:hypothetical protein
MGVQVLFRFSNGARGVVLLDYDHFNHATKGTWSTMCPLVGSSHPTSASPGRYPTGVSGTFSLVGGVCSLEETDQRGRSVLAAEMRYFPKLGGVSGEEMRKRKLDGPFRIHRANVLDGNPTGTWELLGGGQDCLDFSSWSTTCGPSSDD